MKNKILYTITCLSLFLASGCNEEFLNIVPADQPTLESFYGNSTQVRAATASLYGRPWFDYQDKFGWAAGDGLPGDLYNDYLDEGQLFFFSFSSTNTVIADGWRGLYNVVAFSNAIINDMPRIAGGKGVPEQVISSAVGEARFMRASAYYFLVEFWGAIPIVENAAALVSSGNLDVPKNTVSTVYEFMIRDLEFAAANLPVMDEPGRVTQWSAKGMLAKVYVTRAQQTKDPEDFNKAKAYAQDVIQNSGLVLMDNYADLFKIENNNNPESLFALQWTTGEWGIGNSRQAVFGRNKYVTNNDQAWGGWKSATESFMQNLEDNADGKTDLRRKSTYMVLGDHYPEISKVTGGYTYNILRRDDDGGELEAKPPLLNNIKKYIVGHAEDVGVSSLGNQAVPLNLYMLRLADVYLIYAEAVLGVAPSTNDATALNYLNEIRARAGLDGRNEITFENIFHERRVEFGMEGINWFDVKRYYYRDPAAALQYLNDQQRADTYERLGTDPDTENKWEGYQLEQPDTPVLITDGDWVLPIPTGEVTANPLLASDVEAVAYTFN